MVKIANTNIKQYIMDNEKQRVLYKEVFDDSSVLTPEQQVSSVAFITGTKLIEATQQEIDEHKQYFEINGKCQNHLIYDKPSFMYDFRYCGICGAMLAMI